MKNIKGVFIDGTRSGYAPEQCGETFSINELIERLEELKEWSNFNGDEPVYLYNDNGYTYGHINTETIDIGTYIDGEVLKLNEF